MSDALPAATATVTGSKLFRVSNGILSDAAALRARAEEDGYLFIKRLIPAEDVHQVRRDLLGVVNAFGWLAPGAEVDEGIIDVDAINRVPENEMRTDIGVSSLAYEAVQKLESVHRLPHHEALLQLYRVLFDREVLVHPRHIVRMITGHDAVVPTPVHQDFPLIQGSPRAWTCWIPIGNCDGDLGGLTVLAKSHKLGCLPIQSAQGAGGIAAQLCPGESDWVEDDFEAGDVLTFPSYTVHKGRPCYWRDRIRLSMDIRYQAAGDAIEGKSLLPHCELGWDEIYADWEHDDLKYYWRRMPQQLVEWDATLLQPSRRIC